MQETDFNFPSTWARYRPSLCQGCRADCCRLPVEADKHDLLRLGLLSEDEAEGSLKRAARRLIAEGLVVSFRARTGLFTLAQRQNGDCVFLGGDRLCTKYEQRPEVCRRFPEKGPRPGFCPAKKKGVLPRNSRSNTPFLLSD